MVTLYIGGISWQNEFPCSNNVIQKYDVILDYLSLLCQAIIIQQWNKNESNIWIFLVDNLLSINLQKSQNQDLRGSRKH
jgi:hypothetical protein